MLSTFNNAYQLLIKTSVILIGTILPSLILLIHYQFFYTSNLYIPLLLTGVILSVVFCSYLYVILSIPLLLPQKFDLIKNNVALNKYSNLQEFQTAVSNFMVSFFNFKGVDIVGGKFHFTGCEPVIIECGVDLTKIEVQNFSKNKLKLPGNHTAFFLPIELANQELGYMILVTKGFTLPFVYSILQDFENYYLDDQILHFKGFN